MKYMSKQTENDEPESQSDSACISSSSSGINTTPVYCKNWLLFACASVPCFIFEVTIVSMVTTNPIEYHSIENFKGFRMVSIK